MSSFKPLRRKAKPKTKYKHSIDHYAVLYKIPRPTICKYHGKNYPLDDPKKLLEVLLAQRSPNRPNVAGLREFIAGKSQKSARAPTPTAARMAKEGEALSSMRESTEDPTDALEGFHREIERLKTETDNAYRAYLAEDDAIEKSAYWKLWKEMLEQWGKLAKIAPEAEREAGSMVKKADVNRVWSRTFKEVRTSLETMKRRMSIHPTFKSLNPVDVELAIEGEVVKVMTLISKGEFTE